MSSAWFRDGPQSDAAPCPEQKPARSLFPASPFFPASPSLLLQLLSPGTIFPVKYLGPSPFLRLGFWKDPKPKNARETKTQESFLVCPKPG